MNGNGNQNLPDLSRVARRPTHAAAQFTVLVRHLPAEGLLPLEGGAVKRSQYLDAQELLAEIRQIVREEIANALANTRRQPEA